MAVATIDVRFAGSADASALATIHAACFAKNWDADAIIQFLGVPGCLSLVASTTPDHQTQGFLIIRGASDEAELLTLAVDPAFRRHGLARALLDAATAVLRAAGAKQLFIEVDESNSAARGLYQSFGAVVVLSEADDHPDVEELHRRAAARDPRISLSTVYRTVRLFESEGILERHEFGDGRRARYEPAGHGHHDHLINVSTGEVIEFKNEQIERLQETVARELGFRLIGHRLELFGTPLKGGPLKGGKS